MKLIYVDLKSSKNTIHHMVLMKEAARTSCGLMQSPLLKPIEYWQFFLILPTREYLAMRLMNLKISEACNFYMGVCHKCWRGKSIASTNAFHSQTNSATLQSCEEKCNCFSLQNGRHTLKLKIREFNNEVMKHQDVKCL